MEHSHLPHEQRLYYCGKRQDDRCLGNCRPRLLRERRSEKCGILKALVTSRRRRGKHPAVAANQNGETLLVWTEGTGWAKGGGVAWQLYDQDGKATAEKGRAPGVPVWGLPTAYANAEGNFVVVY